MHLIIKHHVFSRKSNSAITNVRSSIYLSVTKTPKTAHNQFWNKHDSSLTYGGLKLANFKPKMELSKPEMELFGHSRIVTLSL